MASLLCALPSLAQPGSPARPVLARWGGQPGSPARPVLARWGGQRAPELDLQDLKGGHHTLADYKGKIVLLNFWATYCVPCATEMPMLAEMQRRYKGKLVVIAASIDDPLDRNKLQPFLHKHKADNLTLMVGPTLETLYDVGMGDGLPATLFIDADGNVVGKHEGALKRPDLEKRLAQMTGSSQKAPVKTSRK